MHLLKLLETYWTLSPVTREKAEQCKQFWKKHHHSHRAFYRDCFDDGHFTAGVLVLNTDRTKVLLMKSKKFWTYQHFWGHADGETNLRDVALREFQEESGIEPSFLTLSHEIGSVDIHEIPEMEHPKYGYEPAHRHYDINFVWILHPGYSIWYDDDDIEDISWFDVENLETKSAKFCSGLWSISREII